MRLKLFFSGLVIITSISLFGCSVISEPDDKKDAPSDSTSQDSTSQDFSFEISNFGIRGPLNNFYDAWIFDENNIWAVGTVYLEAPSAPVWGKQYNIMQWNGKEWKTRGDFFDSYGIYSIWALDTGRVYMTAGFNGFVYKDGQYNKTDFRYTPGFKNREAMSRIWGSSEDNVWGVGIAGVLMHYDGKEWKRINYDPMWDFHSITGSSATGVAYASGINYSNLSQGVIVKLQNSTAEIIYKGEIPYSPYNSWVLTLANEKELYVGNNPIWKLNLETKATQVLFTPSSHTFISSACTVSPMDIYFYGNDSTSNVLIHYNGKRFKEFKLPVSGLTGGIKATSKLAIAVGADENLAQIIKIRRK